MMHRRLKRRGGEATQVWCVDLKGGGGLNLIECLSQDYPPEGGSKTRAAGTCVKRVKNCLFVGAVSRDLDQEVFFSESKVKSGVQFLKVSVAAFPLHLKWCKVQ